MEKRMLQEFVEQHFPEVNPGVKARLACFYAHRELSDTGGESTTALLQASINQHGLDTGQVIASIDTMDLFLRQIQRAKFLGSQERNPWYQAPRQ
jgi:hypothetical protein